MFDNQNTKNWYALYTHSRCEFKVEESLKAQGITAYLPVKKPLRNGAIEKRNYITFICGLYFY